VAIVRKSLKPIAWVILLGGIGYGFFWNADRFVNKHHSTQKEDKTEEPTPFNITVKSLTGEDKTIIPDGVLLINFWATWCPECIKEIPSIKAFWDKWGKYTNLNMISVSVDNGPIEVMQMVAKEEIKYPVYRDPGMVLAKKFGIRGVPALVIVDQKGVIKIVQGRVDWNSKKSNAFWESLNDRPQPIKLLDGIN